MGGLIEILYIVGVIQYGSVITDTGWDRTQEGVNAGRGRE